MVLKSYQMYSEIKNDSSEKNLLLKNGKELLKIILGYRLTN